MDIASVDTTSIDVSHPVLTDAIDVLTAPTSWGRPTNSSAHVPIEALQEADSPRLAGIDPAHVRVLAENVDELPPIVVHRATMRVVDGMHRLHAARSRNRTTVEVVYFDGSESEAFVLAVEANVKHGLPLPLSDRKKSAERILQSFPEWSDRAIAATVGLSHKTVGVIRRSCAEPGVQPVTRIGRDGRARSLNPAEGRLRACDLLSRRPDASLREVARSAGISVATARDVRERLTKGKSPLPGGVAPGNSRPRSDRPRSDRPRPGLPSADLVTALDSLKRDPALKYSSEGRAMVRWLEARIIRKGEADLVMRAPSHQATKIAAIARAFAACWDQIAAQLEHQASSGT